MILENVIFVILVPVPLLLSSKNVVYIGNMHLNKIISNHSFREIKYLVTNHKSFDVFEYFRVSNVKGCYITKKIKNRYTVSWQHLVYLKKNTIYSTSIWFFLKINSIHNTYQHTTFSSFRLLSILEYMTWANKTDWIFNP